jgi:hypothetical protein
MKYLSSGPVCCVCECMYVYHEIIKHVSSGAVMYVCMYAIMYVCMDANRALTSHGKRVVWPCGICMYVHMYVCKESEYHENFVISYDLFLCIDSMCALHKHIDATHNT